MGCGTSAPPRAIQPLTVGPPSVVPHHPEASPMDAYRVSPKKERTQKVSPAVEGLMFQSKTTEKPSAPSESPPASITNRLRSMDLSAAENLWDTGSSPANRLPRHTLATLLRTILDYLPSTHRTITTTECQLAIGSALRQYPAFMPEDEYGNLASPPKTGTTEENAKKDMKAWLVASGFDRPSTPTGHCVQEPSPASQALTTTYLSIKARINDTFQKDQSVSNADVSSSSEPPKVIHASPIHTTSQLAPIHIGEGSSPVSPTKMRRGVGSPLGAGSPLGDDENSNSFLDRDTIVLNSEVLLEECTSDQESMSASIGLALSPSNTGLDVSAHSVVSSTAAGRPPSPTRTMKHIYAYREMRDVGLSRHKRKLADRICAWQELVILSLFEDPANAHSPLNSIPRSVSQTAAPLTTTNLANLQSQLMSLRSRAASTALHPSPDNDDFFMNVPSAICWYYGSEIFNAESNQPSLLSQILPPCVLRFPYHPVYGFAVARSADLTQRAVQKLQTMVKDEDPLQL